MLTIGIPQLYCGASGKKGAYNRQEIGLARALAAAGCRGVAFYPAVGAKSAEKEDIAPHVRAWYLPARAVGNHAFFQSWQPLLEERVDAVHVMGDNSLGVPGLYRFCRRNDIFFYSQLGAVFSDASGARRGLMDFLARQNLAVYRKTPTFAKTPAVAEQLQKAGVPCAGVMPVGLDTALLPSVTQSRAELRKKLGLSLEDNWFVFVGRLEEYKRPMDLIPVLQNAPGWRAVLIGQGTLNAPLAAALKTAGLAERCLCIPVLPNTAVQEYYHACDAFVNCSEVEIFGMSLLEAMYAGCAPVAHHAPGPDLIVENGISGVLADTPQQMGQALCRLAQTPGAGRAMGEAAHNRVQQQFLWNRGAEMALAMLRQEGVKARG